MPTLTLPQVQRRLSEEAARREQEREHRERTLEALARELIRGIAAKGVRPGDRVEFTVRTEPPESAAELAADLRDYLRRNAAALGERALIDALDLLPAASPTDLDPAWSETRRRMLESFAADPDLAAEFSAPLVEEPEDEALRRAWAREFRTAGP